MNYIESSKKYENLPIDKEDLEELKQLETDLEECSDYISLLNEFVWKEQFLSAYQFVNKSIEEILKDLENNSNEVGNLLSAIVDFDTELARKAIDFFDNKITSKNYEIYNDLAEISKDFLEDNELSVKYYEKYYLNLKSLSDKYSLYLTLKDDLSDVNLFKNVKKDVEICLSFKDNSDYIISEKQDYDSNSTDNLLKLMKDFEYEKDKNKLELLLNEIKIALEKGANVNSMNEFDKTPLVVMLMTDSNYYRDESIYLTKMLISAGYNLDNDSEGSNIFDTNENWGANRTWLYDFIDSYK
jgi:hypothetical protein